MKIDGTRQIKTASIALASLAAAIVARLLPSGGASGQVLTKASAADYDVAWATPSGGGGGGYAAAAGVKAYLAGVQSMPTGTGAFTTITLDAEAFDSNNFHDLVTNNSRLTVPAGFDGRYLIIGQIGFAAVSDTARSVRLRLNGATDLAHTIATTPTIFPLIAASTIHDLVAGDYVELQGRQNSGGAQALTAAVGATFLTMVRLAA